MKKYIFTIVFTINVIYSQTFDHSIVPQNTCSGIYRDPGGAANYSNNQSILQVICPSVPGNYVTLNFTSFNLENNFDWLTIMAGTSSNPDIIGSFTGTTLPPTITSSATNGCLSIRFNSDGSTTRPGWQANVSCSAVPGPAPVNNTTDCSNAITVCSNSTIAGNSAGFGGQELGSNNSYDGCLGFERQSSWYYFSPSTSGNIEFTISPTNGTDDYDFAIWGPFTQASCPVITGTPPIRCSFAATGGNTGLLFGSGDLSEGAGGDRFVEGLNVTAGQVYTLLVNNFSMSTQPFNLNWNLTAGASLNCTPLPIDLIKFSGVPKQSFNEITWTTSTEINNDYFTIQKSIDGINWVDLTRVDGSGNSNIEKIYSTKDLVPSHITYYKLIQTDFNGSQKSYDPIVVERDENTHSTVGNMLGFYPNPITDFMTLQTYTDGRNQISVIDASGKELYSTIVEGMNTQQLDLSNLSTGLYFIRIENNGNIQNEKLIIK